MKSFRSESWSKSQFSFFFISDNFQLTFLAMAEESNLHQAGSFQPYFPILCTLQFICSVLLPDTKSCYSTSFGKCINGPHSSNNLRWYTVLNFDGNFVLFLGFVQLRAASKIRNCFVFFTKLQLYVRHHQTGSCEIFFLHSVLFIYHL